MLLPPEETAEFYDIWGKLIFFVNKSEKMYPKLKEPDDIWLAHQEEILNIRSHLLKKPTLIDNFIKENPFNMSLDQLSIVSDFKIAVFSKFIVYRSLKKFTVFLTMDEPCEAFGVVGFHRPIADLIGQPLPAMVETVLLSFKDKIVSDGIYSGMRLIFGPGFKRRFNENYNRAKKDFGIITNLKNR
ncbi:MAG: hypothetical protein ACKOX1_05995 [Ignavibacteria bacterium]